MCLKLSPHTLGFNFSQQGQRNDNNNNKMESLDVKCYAGDQSRQKKIRHCVHQIAILTLDNGRVAGNRLSQTCASGTLHCVTLYENQPLDIHSCQKKLVRNSWQLIHTSQQQALQGLSRKIMIIMSGDQLKLSLVIISA